MIFSRHKKLLEVKDKQKLRNQTKFLLTAGTTCPDGLSKACHAAPVLLSLSTGTVTEPRRMLVVKIFQS